MDKVIDLKRIEEYCDKKKIPAEVKYFLLLFTCYCPKKHKIKGMQKGEPLPLKKLDFVSDPVLDVIKKEKLLKQNRNGIFELIVRECYFAKEYNLKEATEKFEELWDLYPRKEGKKAAFNHFRASLSSGKKIEMIEKALYNYIKIIEEDGRSTHFVKQGSTFFNNWEDYLDVKQKSFAGPVDFNALIGKVFRRE